MIHSNINFVACHFRTLKSNQRLIITKKYYIFLYTYFSRKDLVTMRTPGSSAEVLVLSQRNGFKCEYTVTREASFLEMA